jgi:hypothetical protein
MSSPSYATFCPSGHLVESVVAGTIPAKEITECPYCHSRCFYTILEWYERDPDAVLIGHDPLHYDWVKVNNDWFRGEMKVAIYDVSRIKRWKTFCMPSYEK